MSCISATSMSFNACISKGLVGLPAVGRLAPQSNSGTSRARRRALPPLQPRGTAPDSATASIAASAAAESSRQRAVGRDLSSCLVLFGMVFRAPVPPWSPACGPLPASDRAGICNDQVVIQLTRPFGLPLLLSCCACYFYRPFSDNAWIHSLTDCRVLWFLRGCLWATLWCQL